MIIRENVPIEFIEIEPGNFHLFVYAKIGRKKARLLLDTGASKTAFDQQEVLKFIAQSKVVKQEMNSVGLGSNQVETHLSNLPKLKFGDISINQHEIAVLDLSHVNTAYQGLGLPKLDGVLGSDLLHLLEAVIYYKKGILKLGYKS